jgi:D-alanyl-D-alanine carboxypeptidase
VPWNDEKDENVIRSSRVIVIDRQTGKILYDGPAGDEG